VVGRQLKRHRLIGLDTSLFIYFVEAHAEFGPPAAHVFKEVEAGLTAVTSTLTLLELLVVPFRDGNEQLQDDYLDLFGHFPNLQVKPVDLAVASIAARLRADYGIRTADAIQLATALGAGATAFVTNDRALSRVKGIEVVLLG
jgi:predicted nucleic acid-binding protein